jgi:hypothetical protein
MAAIAIPLISQGVNAVSSLLLGQHTARLKNAQSENQAIPAVIQAFDADLTEIYQAYTGGHASASQCIAALRDVDANIYAYLSQLGKSGKPGIAWSDVNGMAGKCDKTCTASCCIYFGDLGPALSDSSVALGGQKIRGWGKGDPRLSGTTVKVPAVFASKYGGTNRAGYTLNWIAPRKTIGTPQQVITLSTARLSGSPGAPSAVLQNGATVSALSPQGEIQDAINGSPVPSSAQIGGFSITTIILLLLAALAAFLVGRK